MTERSGTPRVLIEPWGKDDLDLLRQLNLPEMKRYLGGSESDEQILERHERYVRFVNTGKGCIFRIVLLPEREKVGSIGYWERVWHGETVYEMGWAVLTAYQGRGIATAALAATVAEARARQKYRYAHAFPSVDNLASNGVCRRAGFELLGETDFEFPPGQLMCSNDWCLDLTGTN